MEVFFETLAALLVGVGLILLGWRFLGWLSAPIGAGEPVLAVVPARGDGEGLEHEVRALLWLRSSGQGRFAIVIADCGLSGEGRALAQLLEQREADVSVRPAAELGGLLDGEGAASRAVR